MPLPAVLTVKEGGITPRYPSIPGRLKAKRAPVERGRGHGASLTRHRRGVRLVLPPEQPSTVQMLGIGHGQRGAAVAVVDVLEKIGVVGR